jgi:hypothetical protein
MAWSTPEFVEIKMDAEIGSYQEDYAPPLEDGEASAPDEPK